MITKTKALLFALIAFVAGVPSAFAAALDTSQLSDITASMNTAASWLSGPVTVAIVALIVAGLIIAIVKYAGRKAKPGS